MRLDRLSRRGLAACVSVLRVSKNSCANPVGHAGRLFLASCLALIFVAVLSQRAEAQVYRFQFSGPTSLMVDVFLTTIDASGTCAGCRQATGIDGGGANTWSAGIDNGAISALGSATIDSVTPNFIFNPSKTSGVGDGVFRNGDAITLLSTAANNNVGSDRDIILWANGSVDRSSVSPAGSNQTGGGGDVGGAFSVTQVPGPLAGAGMLSYLAVLLMGLVWRGKWLVARTRRWLTSDKTGEAQTA